MDRPLPTALITGASSGIGRELAKVLAEKRHRLILVARDRPRLEALASDLNRRFLVPVRVEVCDLSDRDALEELISRLRSDRTEIDVLVNNAGFGVAGPFVETEWDREREMIDVNVTALVRLTKAFLPPMVSRGSGRILQIASTAAFQPGPYLSLYFATKSLVLSFSEALSAELRGTGVTVTAYCPGLTRTGFERRLGAGSGIFDVGLPVARADSVAEAAYSAMMGGKRISIHGTVNRVLVFLSRWVPRSWGLGLLRRMIGRKSLRRTAKAKDLPAA